MRRSIFLILLALCVLAGFGEAQALLVPSTRAPFAARFDLQAAEAQYLFLPQSPLSTAEGPYQFRFRHPALQAVLESPATVSYLTARDGGFHLHTLHMRATDLPGDALGPQEFEVVSAAGEVAGTGTILVVTRAPEAVDLTGADLTRIFEVHRATPVRVAIRTHQNFSGRLQVVNPRDFELSALEEDDATMPGTTVLRGELRPLRAGATELRLAAETLDGREVELVFPGLTVREPEPYRVSISGGPLYLDALGLGTGQVVIRGFRSGLASAPVIVSETGGELIATRQSFDREAGELTAQLEFTARTARPAGSRELREVVVRAGPQLFRGFVEVVGAPVVSSVQTEQHQRAALAIGGPPTLLRVSGLNLDALRLDCSQLGSTARCENLGSGPTELVERVALGTEVREGEIVLPLVPTGKRAELVARPHSAGVRVQVERPAIPLLLTQTGLLELNCDAVRSCRPARGGESVRVSPEDALHLQLLLDDAQIPVEFGWQRVVISVTRVRGEQRQPMRTFGTPAAPRTFRRGLEGGALSLIDAGADPRHGDQFIVRVEHAVEQYPAENRSGAAASEAFVRQIYVDGGMARRLTGDIAVQPVLLSFGGPDADQTIVPLYPNAGLGLTWQFLNERLEPHPFSAKLQLLATDIKNLAPGGSSARPAVLLSANLRIPGTDAAKPLVLMTGVARMWGDDPGWRVLAGAGMDLGLARLIFGG